MDKEKSENQKITIHWWNFGTKTLDFKGTYKDYLLKRGITVKDIVHPNAKDSKGWRFIVSTSNTTATLDIYGSDYAGACDEVIKVFLTIMGDKATFSPDRRDARLGAFHINW